MVHAIDGHSNNSAAALAPPSAYQLAKLAHQSQAIQTEPAPVPISEPPMRSLRRRLTRETRQLIVSRYEAGESAKALSKECGISRHGVRRFLKGAGVNIRTQFIATPETGTQIVELYESGLTIRQVAAQVGCAYGTVRGLLNNHGDIMRVSPVGKPSRREG